MGKRRSSVRQFPKRPNTETGRGLPDGAGSVATQDLEVCGMALVLT